MDFQLQVGKVAFTGSLPFPIQWRDTDRLFQNINADAVKTVRVTGVGEPFDLPEEKPRQETESLRVWEQDGDELRAYTASYYPGQPTYALSRRSGDNLHIRFGGDPGVLMNPNMQIWNLLHLEQFLLETDGIVLHSCYTMYRDKAILFTAPSGTGKTTHAKLWEKCYSARVINGDKCLLQRHGDQWQAWGYPYHGSAPECENLRFPIEAIVIIRQSPTDYVEEVGPARRLGLLYSECTVNSWDQDRIDRALGLLTDLVTKVKVVILHCTMEDNAAHVLHEYLYGGCDGTV